MRVVMPTIVSHTRTLRRPLPVLKKTSSSIEAAASEQFAGFIKEDFAELVRKQTYLGMKKGAKKSTAKGRDKKTLSQAKKVFTQLKKDAKKAVTARKKQLLANIKDLKGKEKAAAKKQIMAKIKELNTRIKDAGTTKGKTVAELQSAIKTLKILKVWASHNSSHKKLKDP